MDSLRQTSINKVFEFVVTPEDVARPKPHPDMSLLAAKKLGVLPEETVMVVDTINDIISGNAAGMKTIAVKRHNSKQLGSHLMNDVNPNVAIDDLSTLAEIISQL